MKQVLRSCTIAILAILILPRGVLYADSLDPQTRGQVESLIAKHRENRARIKNLRMSGSIQEDHYPRDGHWERLRGTFKYYESGKNRRIDQYYALNRMPDGTPALMEGKTGFWATNGERTISYITDTELAAITEAAKFDFVSEAGWLETTSRSRNWNSHVAHIERLLNRGWKPDKERIWVAEETVLDKPTAVIEYESYRGGGRTYHRWVFDPSAGYEIIRASGSGTYPDGRFLSREEAEYRAGQIAPNVWRVVSGVTTLVHANEEGGETKVVIKIENKSVAVNEEHFPEETFTFTGFGTPVGMVVADVRETPVRQFVVGAAPLTEEKLDEALKVKDAFAAVDRPDLPDAIWQNPMFLSLLIGILLVCIGLGGWWWRRWQPKESQ